MQSINFQVWLVKNMSVKIVIINHMEEVKNELQKNDPLLNKKGRFSYHFSGRDR